MNRQRRRRAVVAILVEQNAAHRAAEVVAQRDREVDLRVAEGLEVGAQVEHEGGDGGDLRLRGSAGERGEHHTERQQAGEQQLPREVAEAPARHAGASGR